MEIVYENASVNQLILINILFGLQTDPKYTGQSQSNLV